MAVQSGILEVEFAGGSVTSKTTTVNHTLGAVPKVLLQFGGFQGEVLKEEVGEATKEKFTARVQYIAFKPAAGAKAFLFWIAST